MKKVGLASDHAGFELKEFVKTWLTEKGYPCKDFGTYSTESCDYADYAHPLALAIEAGECGPGVAICGSGEGISMTLNKHQGIRAALCLSLIHIFHRTEWNERSNDPLSYSSPYFNHWFFLGTLPGTVSPGRR